MTAVRDPEGVVEFKADGKKYRLFFGIRAEKEAELHYDLPFYRAVQKITPGLKPADMADKAKVAEASANIRFTDVAKMFEFALLKHHPDIEEADVDNLIDSIGGLVQASELLGRALTAALGAGEQGGGNASGQNPPPASRKSKTGSRSLVTG